MRLFELLIGDVLTDEVFAISLVSEPAIEENFVWFANEKMQFQKIDNEKRLVVGPVLIPNKKILRIDGEGQPYEVFFSPETIEKLAQNYLKKGYQGETTIEHEERVAGVSLVESWIKTTKLDKSNSYGLNLPVGTWMGAFKVDSDIVWEDYVKNGEVKGFSIEGLFEHSLVEASKKQVNIEDLSEEQSEQYLNQIRAIIKKDKRYSKGKRVDMESYTDYPIGVKNNAKKGIDLNKKSGNKCATPVGKARAQQLAQGKPISLETIKRMYSYLSRAEEVYRDKQNDSTACGNISYLLWGGLAALGWSKNKLKQLGELSEMEANPSVSGTYPGEVAKEDIKLDHELILFPTKEMAERVSKLLGCEGSHEHKLESGETYYMPCEKHMEEIDIELEEVRVNDTCPDGFEHLMPDGTYMCGKSMDYAQKYSNNERRKK